VTEGRKTGIMALVAMLLTALAWGTSGRTTSLSPSIKSMKGKVLFEKFTDPVDAASLKLLRYDSAKEDYIEFEVAQDRKTQVWTLPSHESYPADAVKQMSEAANLFVGLKTLDVASEKKSDQELYGVIEPNKQNADKGGQGVGMLVQMRNAKGDALADLIIGKEIGDNKKQRFVRIPSEDVIYVAEIETAPLSTEFKQWIEPDLLKLSSNDIETLSVREYQLITVNQGLALRNSFDADLNYTTSNGQWQASKITNYELDPPADRTIGTEEQLNTSKINEIKNALDNLRIADVIKKPAGLAGDLKGDRSLLSNKESLASLQKRGFFPNPNQQGDSIDFYAKSGELIVTLKDGVQYSLRFGNGTADLVDSETKEGEPVDTTPQVSINRYLLVTTRVDESKFPPAELEKVPQTVEELKAIEELKKPPKMEVPLAPVQEQGDAPKSIAPAESNEPTPANTPVTEDTPPAEPSPTSDPGSVPAVTPKEPASAEPVPPVEPAPVEPAPEIPKSAKTSSPNGSSKLIAFQEPQETDPATPVIPSPAPAAIVPAQVPADSEPTMEEWKERLEATKEKITKENQRKIDLRNDKLLAAKKKVAELNGRFADWYYVVSEDDFKKMKVTLSELIQPKTGAAASPQGGAGFPVER
jgi:hypothetical protein